MLDPWLGKKLEDRRRKNLFRALQQENNLLDFTSNDYLGLARSEELYEYIRATVAGLPKRNGSTGSRLLSGNTTLATHIEKKLAGIFQSEAALLFNSGYTANLAVLSAIPQKDDTIIYDELAHASIKDGARLSLARKYSFRHNDLHDLEKKISRSTGRAFVVVESVYSMDGDECPLDQLIALKQKSGFTMILDEAHSTGVRGPAGSGLCVERSLQHNVDIRVYTFGKAMGVCGACVAGSDHLIQYLINFARPLIYSTAGSPHTTASIGCAFDFLSRNIDLQDTLKQKTKIFLDTAGHLANRTKSFSAIQTIIVPGNEPVKEAAHALQQQGFDVRPILSPTVPLGSERLRICLHTFNEDADIAALAKTVCALAS